jgi:hypothetical protein
MVEGRNIFHKIHKYHTTIQTGTEISENFIHNANFVQNCSFLLPAARPIERRHASFILFGYLIK